MISLSDFTSDSSVEGLVDCFAVVVFDFGTGALIFVESLVATPRTCCYCFTASDHCVPISKTFHAAHYSFIIFVNFSFCLFSMDFYDSR